MILPFEPPYLPIDLGHGYCKWKYDDVYDYFETECEKSFCTIDGKLKDNDIKFCCYCGKLIKEKS